MRLSSLARSFSNKPPYYLEIYEQYFDKIQNEEISFLELGVFRGGSLELWAEYFTKARIVGIDIEPCREADPDGAPEGRPRRFRSDRIAFRQGAQEDAVFLEAVTEEFAPDGWDVVIDDCAHIGALSLASFRTLFPKVKPGGFYIVEDWATGYWPRYPDGRRFALERHFTEAEGVFPSHQHGLPGFLKQFVDEMAMDDIRREVPAAGRSSFDYVHFYKGVAIVRKRAPGS
jgi:hypothetical protein